MIAEFKEEIRKYAEEPLTKQLMLDLLKDYKRPNDKIHELIKKGEITQVKRGLYIPGPKIRIEKPSVILLANHLRGPSYVSLETALSYWHLIPEKVYEISSLTLKESKIYKTPAGRFSYMHASLPYYALGIRRIQITQKQAALIAGPEKALCDRIIMTSGVFLRSPRQTMDFLIEDLRMEEENLRGLNINEIGNWINVSPKSASLAMLVKTIENL